MIAQVVCAFGLLLRDRKGSGRSQSRNERPPVKYDGAWGGGEDELEKDGKKWMEDGKGAETARSGRGHAHCLPPLLLSSSTQRLRLPFSHSPFLQAPSAE